MVSEEVDLGDCRRFAIVTFAPGIASMNLLAMRPSDMTLPVELIDRGEKTGVEVTYASCRGPEGES